MNLQAILNDIESLPPEKQEEVADFIAFLKSKFNIRKKRRSAKGITGAQKSEGFFGMWADRESMKDSSQWVRQLREREWQRHND